MPALAVAALLAVLLAVPAAKAAPTAAVTNDARIIARRGATVLTESSVQAMIDALPSESRDRLRQTPSLLAGFVREKLLQAVLLDEARGRKWDQRPEVAERAREAREAVIVDSYLASITEPDAAYPSDAELQAAYDANKTRLMQPRRYRLAQIFLPVADAGDAKANAAAQRTLADAAAQVGRQRAEFGELAKRLSKDDASAAKGGEIGWVDEAALLPQMRNQVAGLQPGQLGEPLRAADGWHLIRLIETRPAAPAPLADVRPQIVRALREQRQQALERQHVDALLKAEPARIDEIGLDRLIAARP